MSKWTLRSPRRELVGRLERISVSKGAFEDRDTNFVIVPDDEHSGLLVNRKGQPNANGKVFGEVQVWGPLRGFYGNWVDGMVGSTVTVRGVYVDDNNHDDTTEIHPVDLIAAPVQRSAASGGDWITERANRLRLRPGIDLFAYRFAAASDTRKGSFGGLFFEGPPLSRTTRGTAVTLDFPAPPAVDWIPVVEQRTELAVAADAEVTVTGSGSGTQLRIGARCKAVGDGGPGLVLGEAIAYWKDSSIPEVALEPTSIRFGVVEPFTTATKPVRIRNVGLVPLVITVAAPSSTGVFTWHALDALTIAPGQSHTESLTFRPRQAGAASGSYRITTNDARGPTTVVLSGTGRAGIPD